MSPVKAPWKGFSGNVYEYTVYNLDTEWNEIPGNYIFAKKAEQKWVAIYIGETRSFSERLPNHEKRPCALRNGATHIHAHVNKAGEAVRKAEEADLIKAHKPACNG